MKYDLTKCNNLRWESGNEEGLIKTDVKEMYLLFDTQSMNSEGNIVNDVAWHSNEWEDACFDDVLNDFPNIKIIPRDPDTYTDWQVGDVVSIDEFEEIDLQVVVAARINDIVICKYIKENMVFGRFTCEELKKKGRLVLTDYEKELKGESKCEFKEGDVVLVRDGNSEKWISGIFETIIEDDAYPYLISGLGKFKRCIPYNEKTWRLLGTTDNYEEE